MNYYNEFDPFAAAWLRELIKAGLIPNGDVDERSIVDVRPDELRAYTQCHFFAGIGGWSRALQLAGWPIDRPVWTGSCPCQPFSSAGNQKGKEDERHLFPAWLGLISECRPPIIFGEQVASAIAHGWLDDVYQGLEAEGYACGSAILPACGVGAPHKRDRLWFAGVLADSKISEREQSGEARTGRDGASGHDCHVADSSLTGLEGRSVLPECPDEQSARQRGMGTWSGGEWINCPDGKQRLVEPSIPLLAHGVRNRVGKLRGYGNAIVPQVAARFIQAVSEALR